VKIRIPANLISPAGNYADTLTLRLFQITGTGAIKRGNDQTVQTRAAIESRAQVNIAGASAPTTYGAYQLERLDFGALTSNKSKKAIVQVRATRPVMITVSSQNGGLLKHQTIPSASIRYGIVLDGSPLGLDSTSMLTRTPAMLNLNATNYDMLVTIGDTTGRPAGAYLDRVTVNVMPQ